ncbi:ABC transporter transmembrane domain-containing protein [Actinoplanes sp. TRM 88003]|uniref:ABC transporter transmembrane domain-containing protein n=1 Tax=Paractinoplanes aksuensis TaxID=2939490 RepID=A0ABT1DEQ4_9ACTN|nr:ABC transporter transmembrane domain-containing protein [Actinoplanes aksuensis]MCO8269279.1 ABC transporter transmembrane domain-containing protein [Actinoplanes aksuensis]
MRGFVGLLRSHRLLLAGAIAAGALNQLLTIAGAAVGAYLVGLVATGAGRDRLMPWFWLLLVLIPLRAAAPYLESVLAHIMAFRALADVRGRVHAAFERLAPAGLTAKRSGDLGTTVVADVEALEVFFAHTLSPLVVAVTVPFTTLVALGLIHPVLPLVVLPVLIAVATVPMWLARRARAQGEAVKAAAAEVSAETVDAVQGLRELSIFAATTSHRARISAAAGRLRQAQHRHAGLGGTDLRDLTTDRLRELVTSCPRTRTCSTAPWPRTCCSPGPARLRTTCTRRPGPPAPTSSSPPCPRATTRSWGSVEPGCQAGSASGSPWPGPCSPTRRCWCWTSRSPTSTPRPNGCWPTRCRASSPAGPP